MKLVLLTKLSYLLGHLKCIDIILDMLKMVIFIHAVSELPVLDLEDCKYKVNTYGKNYPTISKVVEH